MKGTTGIKKTKYLRAGMPLLTLLLIVAGPYLSCLSVDRQLFSPEKKYPRTNPDDITISYSKPERRHIEIGKLSVRFNSGYKRETALGLLRNTASEYGADGITILPIRRVNDRFSVSNSSAEGADSSIQVENYEISGIMYRYLSE